MATSDSSSAVAELVSKLTERQTAKYVEKSGLSEKEIADVAKGSSEITLDTVEKLAKVEGYTAGGFIQHALRTKGKPNPAAEAEKKAAEAKAAAAAEK